MLQPKDLLQRQQPRRMIHTQRHRRDARDGEDPREDLGFHWGVVRDDEAWAVDEPDFRGPEEGLEVFGLSGCSGGSHFGRSEEGVEEG